MATPGSFLSGKEGGKPLNEEQGLTIGRYLRQERERKNLSLESVAKATRITVENLEALERDDFQSISAPVIVRGFLRNYANQLGLDPKDVLARYEAQIDLLRISSRAKDSPPVGERNPLPKYLIFFILIVIGVAVIFYFFPKTPLPPPSAPPSAVIPPSPAPPVQPPPSPTLPPPAKVSPKALPPEKAKKQPEKPLAAAPITPKEEKPKDQRNILKVMTTEETWLRIRTKEQPVIDVLLQPNQTASWTTGRRFNITVGNAGGIEIFLNGVSQGPLGKSGQVVHLVLPKEIKPSEEGKKKP